MKPGTLPQPPEAKPESSAAGPILMAFAVDDTEYRLRGDSWSYDDEMDLYGATRKAGGLGFPEIQLKVLSGEGSPFLIGCLIFLERRGAGEPITFKDAQSRIGYDAIFKHLPVAEPKDDPAGKDRGSS